MSVHKGGRGPGHICRNFGGIAASTLSAPSLTNSSALGTSPLVLSWSDMDYIVGLYGQLQIASDSGFATITQNLVFFIDGASWAKLDESIGLLTPSGTYYARIRTCRDNNNGLTTVTGSDPLGNAVSFPADVSGWSNTFTDTINVASAVWNSTTGTNKSQYVAISGSPALVITGTAGVGTYCGVRTTTSTTGKRHFEITYTTLVQMMAIGVDDGTTALGPSLFNPPNPGVFYRSDGNIYKNGTAVQTALPAAAQGDGLTCEFDQGAGTVSFFKNGVQLGTTVTGVSMANWFGYGMTFSNDVLTGNFGENAFSMTPTSGYAGW